jgi:DNA primase
MAARAVELEVAGRTVRLSAVGTGEVLGEHGLVGCPKTSGSRGMHVNVRIEPAWDFLEVRRAALPLARAVERRMLPHFPKQRGERRRVAPSRARRTG